MKKILLLIVILKTCFAIAQNDTIKTKYRDIKDLKKKILEYKIEKTVYIDSTFSYKYEIPKWLNLRETGNETINGGTFPPVKKIVNAFLIKGFKKTEFKSFEEFKHIYLTGNVFGQQCLYYKKYIWYGSNRKKEIQNGISARVFIKVGNLIYHSKFVLIKTKTAFLWIQFTSTPETYDINVQKFDELMKKFEILK